MLLLANKGILNTAQFPILCFGKWLLLANKGILNTASFLLSPLSSLLLLANKGILNTADTQRGSGDVSCYLLTKVY